MNLLPLLVHPSNFVAKPLKDESGFTATLATLLGHTLREAEEAFGERDRSYTILGIEFTDGGPQVWFPGNCKHIVVQLSMGCLRRPFTACCELAHEVVHLLSPTGCRSSTNLEEGLAQYFAEDDMARHYETTWLPEAAYMPATRAVRSLLTHRPTAIKELRSREPVISHITAELLLAVCPGLAPDQAAFLGETFARESGRRA